MAPAATVTAAQTVGGPAAGMNPQAAAAAAMAQQAAAPPLKRSRPDFGGSCPPNCFTRRAPWYPFDLRVARALWNLGGGF